MLEGSSSTQSQEPDGGKAGQELAIDPTSGLTSGAEDDVVPDSSNSSSSHPRGTETDGSRNIRASSQDHQRLLTIDPASGHFGSYDVREPQGVATGDPTQLPPGNTDAFLSFSPQFAHADVLTPTPSLAVPNANHPMGMANPGTLDGTNTRLHGFESGSETGTGGFLMPSSITPNYIGARRAMHMGSSEVPLATEAGAHSYLLEVWPVMRFWSDADCAELLREMLHWNMLSEERATMVLDLHMRRARPTTVFPVGRVGDGHSEWCNSGYLPCTDATPAPNVSSAMPSMPSTSAGTVSPTSLANSFCGPGHDDQLQTHRQLLDTRAATSTQDFVGSPSNFAQYRSATWPADPIHPHALGSLPHFIAPIPARSCALCGTIRTPQWRRHRVSGFYLCNKCGHSDRFKERPNKRKREYE
ncbi:hypothetical protein MSAN_01731800 [Mycena sanguinolenta]|uniref:GATA-type domain-containing protein n=1 Tax=Mycena sanguinolenta TaxID=230812 RepID=A0A8H7CT54_9AGAR|nr:hypothetical protein MSAN_01731800 [Mycena sanguinolenta]